MIAVEPYLMGGFCTPTLKLISANYQAAVQTNGRAQSRFGEILTWQWLLPGQYYQSPVFDNNFGQYRRTHQQKKYAWQIFKGEGRGRQKRTKRAGFPALD